MKSITPPKEEEFIILRSDARCTNRTIQNRYLTKYLMRDGLTSAQTATFENHIQGCRACAVLVANIKAIGGYMRAHPNVMQTILDESSSSRNASRRSTGGKRR